MASWSINWSKIASDKADPRANSRILASSFYERHTVQVAQDLIGKILLVKGPRGMKAGRIVETEAYRGDDPASHSSRGETPRSSVMFGDPGVAYVYFIYGMYEMLNFVTEKKGFPGAVLIRALEPFEGAPLLKSSMSGPGRLTRAMGIKMTDNRKSLQGPRLFVLDDGRAPSRISATSRVGIRLGQDRFWRFFESRNPYVSRVPQNAEARN